MSTYIFLASSAYSGSTLLSYLLGAHPDIATVSAASGGRRQSRIDEYRCSCGRLLNECPFWMEVRERMVARGHADFELGHFRLGFDQAPGSRRERMRTGSLRWNRLETARDLILDRLTERGATMAAVGRRNADFAAVVMAVSGGSVYVDASKERMRIRHLRRFLPMPLKVIHLVRDVRGVATSALHHGSSAAGGADAAARNWAATNRTILRHLDDLPPEDHMTVWYEQLCSETEATMSNLYAFCGVDRSRAADPLLADAEQHLIGNRRRLSAWSEITLDERWRSELSPGQQARILGLGSSVQRELYPQERALTR
ncbi:MAG: sulfotransferase [Chloroflexota bacterium]